MKMKFIHAILAVLLSQAAVPIGLPFSPWIIFSLIDSNKNLPLSAAVDIDAVSITFLCWLISIPASMIIGLPLVFLSLVKNKLSLLHAFIINFTISTTAVTLLTLEFEGFKIFAALAIPICICGTVILWLYFKNLTLLSRPVSMLTIFSIILFVPFALSKIAA
jgi:hypothetical protein